jgi:hypothetical protein
MVTFDSAINDLIRKGVINREVGNNFLTRRSPGNGTNKYGKG